jgi:hypothetical protein
VASVFTQILWWLGIALEILILVRSVKGNSCQKYPAFYLYLGTLLLIELLRFSVYTFKPRFYGPFYWYTEFLATTVAYAVILEVYKHALINSPGVARIARTFLWGVLGAVILKATLNAVTKLVWSPATTHAELERDLYAVQALLLAGIIALLAYYAVATGRNLKGIIFGYSTYVYASVISLAFGSLPGYGPRPGWRLVQPIAYLAALLIWSCTLWSYSPNPAAETESKIDREYKLISQQTRRALSKARSFLKMGGEL